MDKMNSTLKYLKARSVDEALRLAGDWRDEFAFVAGGTDLLANNFQGNSRKRVLIDISGIEGIDKITVSDGKVKIGAMVKLSDLRKNELLTSRFPALVEAAESVASPLIRQNATLVGNVLCENRCLFYNQSDWWKESIGKCLKCEGNICIATGGSKACFSELVSDTCPVLISMEAKLEYTDPSGEHSIPLENIYTGDGVKPKSLPEQAIVTAVVLNLSKIYEVVYHKLRQRKSLEFTSLTTSVSKDQDGKVIIAMSGVDPGPVVLRAEGSPDIDELITRAVKKSRAIDNDILTRKYRKQMIRNFLEDSFERLSYHLIN